MKTIGIQLDIPKQKTKQVVAHTYQCSLENAECPLLKQGKCLHLAVLSHCVYGNCRVNKLSSRRAKNYYKELKNWQDEAEKYKLPKSAYDVGMQSIGDYYYLPYHHMAMCEPVKFKSHSCFFFAGSPFVKQPDLTPEAVVTLVQFRPHALLGGEITTYQKEEVPKFLLHLKLRFPELYEKASKLSPLIVSKTPQLVKEINTTLSEIPIGQATGYCVLRANDKLKVEIWDGKNITLSGPFSSFSTFFMYANNDSQCLMTYSPIASMTKVVVTDPALILLLISNNPAII